MENNVMSFNNAAKMGYDYKPYIYDPDQIPMGKIDAVLDFKTWSKRIMAINCFFTQVDTGTKFVITVYCSHQTGLYAIKGSGVDFSNCGVGIIYTVEVARNRYGKVFLNVTGLC